MREFSIEKSALIVQAAISPKRPASRENDSIFLFMIFFISDKF